MAQEKKTVVIVGANRGIGLEFVDCYRKDHEVFALCRKTTKELDSKNVSVIESCDVSSLESLQNAANQINCSVDILIHNAGILSSQEFSSLDQNSLDQMSRQFDINSLGPLRCVMAFGKYLDKGSKIGLMTSRMGSVADNTSGGSYGYRASKSALNAIGKSLAIDLRGKGVSLALLHPGWVKTEMTNFSGHLTPKESVQGLVKVMEGLNLENSGGFWHTNGEKLPW